MANPRVRPRSKPTLAKRRLDPRGAGAQEASLAQLGDQIDKRLRDWAKNDAHARVELGGLLERVRAQLDYGGWLQWVAEHLPFSERSTHLFIGLHQWAGRHPQLFPEVAPLGPTKLYVLMRLGDAQLMAFLARAKHVIPSTGARKTLERMTISELTELVRAILGQAELEGSALLVQRYRARVRGVIRATDALIENRDQVSAEEVEGLHDALIGSAVALSETFGLGD